VRHHASQVMVEPASIFPTRVGKRIPRFASLFHEGETADGGTGQAVAMRIVDSEGPLHWMALVEGF
jgi:hypothetical protein